LLAGTNVLGSPSVDYFAQVLAPLLERMGPGIQIMDYPHNPTGKQTLSSLPGEKEEVFRRGFYPCGGGNVVVDISPSCSLQPINLTDQGHIY
jgi:RNA 3'-terminal phosphate cyclase (ATP)